MTPEPVLVISLHGIGASGAQLMPLAGGWRGGLSTARVAAPDGPVHSSYGGHRWFGVDGSELRPDRINAIRQAFDDVIHKIVQREDFAEDLDRVTMVGASQGAIMGLDAAASGRWPVKALVSFSGLLPPFPSLPHIRGQRSFWFTVRTTGRSLLLHRRWRHHSSGRQALQPMPRYFQAWDTRSPPGSLSSLSSFLRGLSND
jgi:predicted esterase